MSQKNEPIVHAISHIDGFTGYAVHARSFFRAMAPHIETVEQGWMQNHGPSNPLDVVLTRDRILAENPERPLVSIVLALASGCRVLAGAPGLRIGYVIWDSTKLPDVWDDGLAVCDRVWVPSEWARAVMIDHGLSPDRVDVMPEGVDTTIFNPEVAPAKAIKDLPGFKVLNVGKFEPRKATRELIKAFDDALGDKDDAWLVLAVNNSFDPDFDIRRELRDLKLRSLERIVYVPPIRESHAAFASVYTACDAFLGPSRSEGWGLCHMEAMACGLPVITTNYSAPAEWAKGHAYFVDGAPIPFTDPWFTRSDGDRGTWMEPDWKGVREHLVHLYENREEGRPWPRRSRPCAGAV